MPLIVSIVQTKTDPNPFWEDTFPEKARELGRYIRTVPGVADIQSKAIDDNTRRSDMVFADIEISKKYQDYVKDHPLVVEREAHRQGQNVTVNVTKKRF